MTLIKNIKVAHLRFGSIGTKTAPLFPFSNLPIQILSICRSNVIFGLDMFTPVDGAISKTLPQRHDKNSEEESCYKM